LRRLILIALSLTAAVGTAHGNTVWLSCSGTQQDQTVFPNGPVQHTKVTQITAIFSWDAVRHELSLYNPDLKTQSNNADHGHR